MSAEEQGASKERLKTYPIEPFNKDTNVYPYYVIFARDGVKVRVPIALDANAYRCVQEKPSLFVEKLNEQLSSRFPGPAPKKPPFASKSDSKKSYILISDTLKKDTSLTPQNKSSKTTSLFDELVNFRKEFRRLRCFYGLTYDDVAQSISNCYGVDQSAYMLYRLEMCSFTAWKHSQELTILRRWIADMKIPKQRARLFPPWKLKQSLLIRYEKLAGKSVTFTKAQQEVLEEFYSKTKNPSNENLQELKQQLGLQVWKIRYWLKEKELEEKSP